MEGLLTGSALFKLPESLCLHDQQAATLYRHSSATLQRAQLPVQVCQGLLAPSSMPINVVPMSQVWPPDTISLLPAVSAAASGSISLGAVADTSLASSFNMHQLLAQPTPQPFRPATLISHLEQKQHHQQQQQQHSSATIFFAGVTPIVAAETLLTLFAQFGRVMELNLFRPYKGCRTSKGCGLVIFSQHSEAAAALTALHGRFVWPGARSPMVIEWCDPSKQHKRKRGQPLTPTLTQQITAFSPANVHGLLPAVPISLCYLSTGSAGCLVVPGH